MNIYVQSVFWTQTQSTLKRNIKNRKLDYIVSKKVVCVHLLNMFWINGKYMQYRKESNKNSTILVIKNNKRHYFFPPLKKIRKSYINFDSFINYVYILWTYDLLWIGLDVFPQGFGCRIMQFFIICFQRQR